MAKILLIDDERSVHAVVQNALGNSHLYQLDVAENGKQGIELFGALQPDVVLLDLHLPESHGFDLFRQLAAIDSHVLVIFITADGSSDVVIQAMRMGAFDYLKKPLEIERLRRMVASAVAARKASHAPVALSIGSAESDECFIGTSPTMVEVFKSIGRVAAQRLPVLIRGESGSGKELVARALVDNGNRANKPFMSINCAAIPDALLESELFGHEKGAFTGADRRRIGRFEQCDGGTIFLDEIGDMSSLIQGKVLRLLQEQVFERLGGTDVIRTDVRVIAATHQPLEELVREGKFRQDLLYRLNGYTIQLPALRDRKEDIPALVEYFLRRGKQEMERPDLSGLAEDALKALVEHHWPGNVRELQSVIRQAILNCVGAVITRNSLPESIEPSSDKPESNVGLASTIQRQPTSDRTSEFAIPSEADISSHFSIESMVRDRFESGSTDIYAEVIAEVERIMLKEILILTDGNQSRASEVLGITRGKIRDRIAAFGIKLDTSISIEP
jgi:DNA-binding NtrC family response regulator